MSVCKNFACEKFCLWWAEQLSKMSKNPIWVKNVFRACDLDHVFGIIFNRKNFWKKASLEKNGKNSAELTTLFQWLLGIKKEFCIQNSIPSPIDTPRSFFKILLRAQNCWPKNIIFVICFVTASFAPDPDGPATAALLPAFSFTSPTWCRFTSKKKKNVYIEKNKYFSRETVLL